MKKLTVFTPTYNRAHLLPRLYESLCRQTSQDFIWMIVDDGSTDNTKELAENWKAENKIEIQYFYKQNGGMHTAHNLAYQKIETELNTCIDSDDFMPDDAVENILEIWKSFPDKSTLAGIIGLDADMNRKIIGSEIPKNIKTGTLPDLYSKYKVTGDKKIVLRTDVVKKYPLYPEFKNEKLVPLGTLYLLIAKDYNCIYINKILCIVDYQETGSTKSIFKQYRQSPKGFAYARKLHIKTCDSFIGKIKAYTHLISSAIFSKDISLAFRDINPVITLCMLPFGILLNIYIRIKIKI